ncbi:MAG: hypothetical protein WCH07_06845 [Deltaproteobacteria bacterium]
MITTAELHRMAEKEGQTPSSPASGGETKLDHCLGNMKRIVETVLAAAM